MPNHLSLLGIVHTVISLLALFAAAYTLYRDGKIIPKATWGKYYIWLTVITCITGFPIMKTGQPTQAHALGVMVLILLPLGAYAKQARFFGKFAAYVQVFILSFTVFLSCIPAVVETLTGLPISTPLASGPNDPLVQTSLGIVFVCFLAGVIYQCYKLKSTSKNIQTPDSSIGLS
ncbi:MAG: hypothetical protein V4619_06365 [Bacteroidota bacterium]